MGTNKMTNINEALAERSFSRGLNRYTQTNCQITITDNGYRIYRPPNITFNSSDSSTRTMWGGLIIQPFTEDSNFLIKGHRYIIMFHVKGKSTNNAADIYWSNNAGWSGGAYGLTTGATDIQYETIGANFNGEKDVFYEWTVSDNIWKTCSTSYSNFTAGTSYNCYRDFKWGFAYDSTGSMGTDLYLTNFRCYDLTTSSGTMVSVYKSGVVNGLELVEGCNSMRMYKGGELQTSEFIEW